MTDVDLRPESDNGPEHGAVAELEPTVETKNSDSMFFAFFAFLLAGAALVFAGYVLMTSDDDGGSGSGEVAGEQVVIDISLTEFAITPAMPTVSAGSNVTLRVTNNGTMAHNLVFPDTGETTGDLQPGETGTIELTGVEAGEHKFICSIVGHEGSGMVGMLMVVDGEVPAGANDATHETMTWQEMDAAMEERAMRFVEEEKTEFGGQPLEPEILADGTKRFELTASIIDWEVEPGKIVKAWTYNGMVPGPEMQVDVGDKVEIVLHNELPESTSIHMHGVLVPNSMDGVDPYTQAPIPPGESFTYAFTAREPAVGMYHSHHNAQVQVPNGLAGAFLIGEMPIPEQLIEKGFTAEADQQVTMVLNDAGTIGLTLNGKSFPATQAYTAKVGETMLVHYYNEGLMAHPMHLHQPTGWIIAKDGVPLEEPMPSDTINIAPGERYTVVYKFTDPGVWAWHCHILNHAEGTQGMFGMVTAMIVEE